MRKPDPLAEKTARLRALRLEREAQNSRAARPERSYPVIGLDDELSFGKYRGRLLSEVIESHPDWVTWALENISTFEISAQAEAELSAARDPRRPPRAWE